MRTLTYPNARRFKAKRSTALGGSKPAIIPDDLILRTADIFHKDEQPFEDQLHGSDLIWAKIEESSGRYNSSSYISPSTSIIGSSGVEKSFALHSIARHSHAYVIYSMFLLCESHPILPTSVSLTSFVISLFALNNSMYEIEGIFTVYRPSVFRSSFCYNFKVLLEIEQ